MKTIAYCRVSTDIQDFNRQIEDIKAYCKKENLELVKEFGEKESGKVKVRLALTEMIDYIKENVVDYVIISELSRLGRTSKVLETIEFLNEKKIGLISLKENIKTLNPDKSVNHSSSLVLSILSSINSFELETIKYRSISGIKNSRLKGYAAGSANLPYGYKKLDKMLVIDEGERVVIEQIFNSYLNGNGTTRISNELNKRKTLTRTMKIRAGGDNKSKYDFREKWVDGVVYGILKNPIYKGMRRYKNELLPFPNLQIIEPDKFDKVQLMLKENYNKAGKNVKNNYLLDNRKIECGVCGKTYYPHKRLSGKDNRYICLSRRYKESCGNDGISIDKIERLVQYSVLYRLQNKLLQKLDNKELTEKIENLKKELESLERAYKKELQRESDLVDLRLEADISRDVFNSKLTPIKKQQEIILNDTRLKKLVLNDLITTYKNIKDVDRLKLNYKEGVKLERLIVNKIITKVIIYKMNRAVYEFQNKQDKVLLIEIISGSHFFQYFISQRENFVYDLENRKIIWI